MPGTLERLERPGVRAGRTAEPQFFQAREAANHALQMAGATFAVIPTAIVFTFTQK